MEHLFWLLLLIVVFIFNYFLFNYGLSSKGSLKSFTLFYPALGGILVTLYYIFTGPFISEGISKSETIESRNVFEFDTNHIPIHSKLLKNQIKHELFVYRNSVFEASDYFKHNSFQGETDYLNIIEISFLKWFCSYFKKSWSYIEGKQSTSKYNEASRKEVFDKVVNENEKLSFLKETSNYKKSVDEIIYLPPNATFEFSIEEDRHVFKVKSDLFDLAIRLFPLGIDNFRPELNDFHRFLLENNKTILDDNFQMRRTAISIELNLDKNISLTDEKEFYEAFFSDFIKKLKKDFDWLHFETKAKEVFSNKTFYDAHFKSRERLILEEIQRNLTK